MSQKKKKNPTTSRSDIYPGRQVWLKEIPSGFDSPEFDELNSRYNPLDTLGTVVERQRCPNNIDLKKNFGLMWRVKWHTSQGDFMNAYRPKYLTVKQ